MKSSDLIAIIDAAKRATGIADPEINFCDYCRRETIVLSEVITFRDSYLQNEIHRHIADDKSVCIPLSPKNRP